MTDSEVASPTPVTQLSFDPFAVDELEDAELDTLAHGAIALDARGIILRYNLAEARLARLDRHSVLGRHFFDEIAPCTRAPEFEGAFHQMVVSGAERVARFAYLFDFKFGAQLCDVEMIRAPAGKRWYVFVTRRDFLEPRDNLADGWAAPLQRELLRDPRADEGVRRDSAEQRVVEVDGDFLATLLHTARERYPLEWPRFCHDWGQRWGRRLMVGLEMESAEVHGASLGELPFARTVELIRNHLGRGGWGAVDVDTSFIADGLMVVDVSRSVLAEISETGRAGDGARGAPLLEGLLGAVFTHLSAKQLTAVEMPGAVPGGNRFVVLGAKMRSSAVTLLESGTVTTPRGLLDSFRSTRTLEP